MVSHIEVHLPDKPPTPNKIGEGLKGPQRKFWREALFLQHDNNKDVSLTLDPIPIISLHEGTKVLCSIIYPSIKELGCSD